MKNLICIYNDYDYIENDVDFMQQKDYEYVLNEANYILEKKEYIRVVGSAGLWNGRKYIDTIIREDNLSDIIDKYMNIDMLKVEVYADRIEIYNTHHDGTNNYELIPFDFEDLTKKELLEYIDKEEYEWYGNKLYKATKDDLIHYCRDKY